MGENIQNIHIIPTLIYHNNTKFELNHNIILQDKDFLDLCLQDKAILD